MEYWLGIGWCSKTKARFEFSHDLWDCYDSESREKSKHDFGQSVSFWNLEIDFIINVNRCFGTVVNIPKQIFSNKIYADST